MKYIKDVVMANVIPSTALEYTLRKVHRYTLISYKMEFQHALPTSVAVYGTLREGLN